MHPGKVFHIIFSPWERCFVTGPKTKEVNQQLGACSEKIIIVIRYPICLLNFQGKKNKERCAEIMLLMKLHYFRVLQECPVCLAKHSTTIQISLKESFSV